MMSRGVRTGVSSRPQGLTVLPPPPPVDYGVFMQGLVQAIQTQVHTQAALQAQVYAITQIIKPSRVIAFQVLLLRTRPGPYNVA
ncbi:hypothetical protein Taro_050440 [Colocasia esculenta]|uniref:Uncharacterized protein n=1 Tax=Colocasia esculenta TaxID=4460 RepID=A0A843XDF9_COLES|nr:hypothetical protein [Colocasia esculenta]